MSFRHLVSPDTRFLRFDEPFELEGGGTLEHLEVAYRCWGRLSEAGDNAILVCHALTGSSDVDHWWAGALGPGRAMDPERDFVVATNTLGGCYGTTGPGSPKPGNGKRMGPDFPAITIRDQVRLQARVLECLGVRGLRLVVGGSMGGMQALEWAAMELLPLEAVAVVGAPACHSPWAVGLGEIQRQAIVCDPAWKDGRYDVGTQPARGLAIARMTAMCSYRSPESFQRKFRRDRDPAGAFQVQSYLRYQGDKLVGRFDANSYLVLSRAMDSHDVARGRGSLAQVLSGIRARVLVLGIPSDVLYPRHEIRTLASGIPGARLGWIESEDGHDAFLIEQTQVNTALVDFRRDSAEGSSPSSATDRHAPASDSSQPAALDGIERRAEQCA